MASPQDALAILQDYERWEGKLILFGDWDTHDGMPKFTQSLYDEWMEIQAKRRMLLLELRKREIIPEAVQL